MNAQRAIVIAAGLCCGALAPLGPAAAQIYPSQPVKIIVPAAPGGPNDIPARLASQLLPPQLGQPVVVEHRPGAGGVLGSRAVAAATPDGYTLLSGGTGMLAVTPALSPTAGYDPRTSFAPVAKFFEGFMVLAVHPSSPWRTVKDLVDHARANPGKVTYAHTGTANIPHLSGELFMLSTGIELVAVPYRSGGESATAVLSQAVQFTFENITTLLPLVAEGKLRALAVTSRTRSPLTPDLPTMIEAGVPDYEVLTFFGIVAPAGTPPEIVGRLNSVLNEGLGTPEMQDAVRKLGAMTRTGSPQEFAAFIAAQMQKWTAVAKAANLKID